MKNIVILISGRGSNMEAIVRACARERGIATELVDHRAFATRAAFDDALAERIDGHGADIVALAGFMRILGAAFVRRFAGKG